MGAVLVIYDAALLEATRCLIRDHLGEFLVTCREYWNRITEPEYAEALTLRRAVSLARE
jgi:hypothetical protein